eukprot:SAG22_NODE_1521_length_4236_cov_6.669567_2_plen_149_part_00
MACELSSDPTGTPIARSMRPAGACTTTPAGGPSGLVEGSANSLAFPVRLVGSQLPGKDPLPRPHGVLTTSTSCELEYVQEKREIWSLREAVWKLGLTNGDYTFYDCVHVPLHCNLRVCTKLILFRLQFRLVQTQSPHWLTPGVGLSPT